MDCTTAEASPGATDALAFVQKIEGQDLQQLKKGTASAESVTLSFWVKCTKTGTAQVNLVDEDNTRMIGQQFTINATNTWEQKTLTFAGDTTGALGNDNNSSLRVEIWLDAGSSYKSGATPTSWETLSSTDYFAGCDLNLGDSTSNDIYITGVQLEVGSVATPFEHRSYGEEWLSCCRYYWRISEETSGSARFANGGYWSTGWQAYIQFPVPMRANPSLVANSGTDYYVINTNTNDYINSVTIDAARVRGCSIYNNTETSGSGGDWGMLSGGTANNAMIAFNAEL